MTQSVEQPATNSRRRFRNQQEVKVIVMNQPTDEPEVLDDEDELLVDEW